MSKWTKTMRDALAEMSEAFSKKQIKMAIGIASDKRYAGGNMTGAVKQIEKLKKGLSDHPQVAAVLKRQNEDVELDEGRMKELHGYIEKGMSAQEIAKKMKLDVKTIKSLMDETNLEEAKFSDDMVNKLRKAYEPLRGKKIPPGPLMKIFDKIDSNEDGLKQLYKADIPFVSVMAMSRLMLRHNYKATDINKLGKIRREDFVLDEAINEMKEPFAVVDTADGNKVVGTASDEKGAKSIITSAELPPMKIKDKKTLKIMKSKKKQMIGQPFKEEVELDERKFEAGKSASGYDIFHKDFSSAMQHATAFAKKKGQPIKKDEIDNKVATGPKKPSSGKENSYTLETEKGKMWSVQVYNMGSKFELNMYLTSSHVPEGEELDEGMKMNDPKLLKMFDKLKKGSKIKLKTSSTISQGKDYVEYIVKSKNTVNKGKVEKITLATVGNENAVKKYLYKRDGTVGFAIGDMGASIDDIKESTNEVPENMAAYLAAITKQLGER